MKKIKELGQLPEGAILCTIDVVGLYPNIPHDEGLAFLKDFLDSRVDKQVTTDTLIELTELVLKNNIFEFSDKTYKQIRGTAIGTKFAPPYAVLFMAALEEKILSKVKKKPSVWWRYIDDIFFIWEHGEESLQEFEVTLEMLPKMLKLPLRTVYCQPICLLSLLTYINF